MSITEAIIDDNIARFYKKRVLEIACGDALLSIAAASHASYLLATDTDLNKAMQLSNLPEHMHLKKCDPTALYKLQDYFDTTMCFNGLALLETVLEEVVDSLMVIKGEGQILFINTLEMDKTIAYDRLLPILNKGKIKYTINENSVYQSITIK